MGKNRKNACTKTPRGSMAPTLFCNDEHMASNMNNVNVSLSTNDPFARFSVALDVSDIRALILLASRSWYLTPHHHHYPPLFYVGHRPSTHPLVTWGDHPLGDVG
jgi:hypothetical protein